jgi:hypothetical protein
MPPKIGIIRSMEMPTESLYNSISIKFLHRKSDSYNVLLLEPSGMLNSYSLVPEEVPNGSVGTQWNLKVAPKFEWQLQWQKNSSQRFTDPRKRNSQDQEMRNSQSKSKPEFNFEQTWKENIETSPFLISYEPYFKVTKYPQELYNEDNKALVMLPTDPLKIDERYVNLQKTILKIPEQESRDPVKEDSRKLISERTNAVSTSNQKLTNSKKEAVQDVPKKSQNNNNSKSRQPPQLIEKTQQKTTKSKQIKQSKSQDKVVDMSISTLMNDEG